VPGATFDNLVEINCGFLQILPQDGNPFLQLTVLAAKPIVDFHCQVIAHVWHTTKKVPANNNRQAPFRFIQS